jgi:hypothetical protein
MKVQCRVFESRTKSWDVVVEEVAAFARCGSRPHALTRARQEQGTASYLVSVAPSARTMSRATRSVPGTARDLCP